MPVRNVAFLSFLSILALGSALFAPVGRAAAQDLVRLCSEAWSPYVIAESLSPDETGPTGISIDILDAAMARLGKRATVSLLPYARCTSAVMDRRFDGQLGVDRNEAGLLTDHTPHQWWVIAAAVRRDWPSDRMDGLDDFRDATAVFVTSYTYPDVIAQFEGFRRRVEIPSGIENLDAPSRLLRMVESGRGDVFFDDETWMRWRLARHPMAIKVLPPPISLVPQFTGFSPERPDLSRGYAEAVEQMLADGTVDRIYRDYLGVSFSEMRRAWSMAE